MRIQATWLVVLFVACIGLSPIHGQEIENLLTNGNLETGDDTGWGGYGGHTRTAVTELVGANIPEDVIEGQYSLHVVVPAAGANFWDAGIQTPFQGGTFESGKQYTWSAWFKSKEGELQINMKPELAQDPWTAYGEQMLTITEEWAEYHVTTPVFAADVSPAMLTWHIAAQAGEFWIDYAQFYVGEYVPTVFKPRTGAGEPSPAGGAEDVPREASLVWEPGVFAVARDVYFGTDFVDVNDASRTDPREVLVSQGQTATSFTPELLEFGTTYFWRIDEVNAAPDSTIFKGDVWSFTTEPYAYPVSPVSATASSYDAGHEPSKTIDGSGLTNGQHSMADTAMWFTDGEPLPAWIQYEFASVLKFETMTIWNANSTAARLLAWGAKDVVIEYSVDGEEWSTLGSVVIPQASFSNAYTGAPPIDLGVEAKFLRLVIESTWNPIGMPNVGLSEVQFLYAPMQAREPRPADGATGVALDTNLTWRPGREVELHEVYFGTDADAVAADTVPAGSQTQGTYTPSALDLWTTYFWRVDQVGELGVYAGDLWSFTTQEYLVVDDFESYDDDDNPIYEAWVDGWEVQTNGSQVGHDIAVGGTFGERIIVRSGRQSMPLYYENTGAATVSEAVLSLPSDQRNWTTRGIKSLSLYFHGDADNSGQLYVKINNAKVAYDGDAADIQRAAWQVWNIDLAAVGTNLSSVTELTIGVEGTGATGILYIDDVRLYPRSPEFVVPAEPDTANLVAHYAFEGNVNDGSGNGFHGTAQGDVTYVAGVTGQAIQFDGAGAHVIVESVGISGDAPRTIAGWAKADTTVIPEWTNVFGFTGPAGNGLHFDIQAVGNTGTTTHGFYGLHRYGWEQDILRIDLEWQHLAATLDGTTVTWYGNGLAIGSAQVTDVDTPGPFHMGKRQDNDNHFPGSVDEVRVYDRALSAEEIAWLAGMRIPRHKPF